MSRISGDLLRFISIVFVLIIHATSVWETSFLRHHRYLSEDFLAVILNQLARFSVPVFVMLSGYGLSMKYQQSKFELKEFFFKRFYKIGLPFFVFTVLILLWQQKLSWHNNVDTLTNIGQLTDTLLTYLLTRGADYHFYFFTIILECYLIFPYLYNKRSKSLWFFLLAVQIVFTAPSHLLFQKMGWHRPAFASSFLIYWLFYFYSGILWAHFRNELSQWLEKIPKSLFLSFGLLIFAMVLLEYIYWANHYENNSQAGPGWYNHFHRQSVIAFALFTVAFFIKFDKAITSIFGGLSRGKFLGLLAALSFSVYIFHTWVLRFLKETFLAKEVIILLVSLCLLSFGLIYLMHRLILPKTLRIILGLPAKSP